MFEGFGKHNCGECKLEGNCMLQGAVEYLHIHNDEVKGFLLASLDGQILQSILTVAIEEAPPIILCMEAVKEAIGFAATYGYCKGRAYQDVPEVFKEA